MRTHKLLIVISVLLVGGIILFFSTVRTPRMTVVWGSSDPPVSERAYYLYRIHGLMESWMQNHANQRQAAFDRSEPVTLVIDTEQKRIWSQERSYAVPGPGSDLATGLMWTLYHVTPKGNETYTGRLHLRLPPPSFRPKPIGDLYLVGQADEGYLSFHLSTGLIESSYQTGMFELGTIARDQAAEGESSSEGIEEGISLVVQEIPSDSIDRATAGGAPVASSLTEQQRQWNDAEASLYKKIEEVWVNRGQTLSGMEVVSGPDGTAGYAQVAFKPDQQHRWYHWFTQFFRVKRNIDGVHLLCDQVGEGLWYVCSAPQAMLNPASSSPVPAAFSPDVEFVVKVGETSASYDDQGTLALGRSRVRQAASSTLPASPWTIQLSSGIEIEIVGLCTFPNQDGAWWGPDGGPLETSPGFLMPPPPQRQYQQDPSGMYVRTTGFTMRRQAVKGIAMVCRIHLPPGHISIRGKLDSSVFTFRVSETSQTLSGSGPIVNRYGVPVDRDHYRTIIFDPGQGLIHYGFGIRSGVGNVPNYGFAWVALENVAASPGQATDFRISEVTELGGD